MSTDVNDMELSRDTARLLESINFSLMLGQPVVLEPGAEYRDVSIVLPYDPKYQNIRIIGNRSRLLGRGDGSPILHFGQGWGDSGQLIDWIKPKLAGMELHGLDLVNGQVVFEFTKGAIVDNCRLYDSPNEGIITSGGGSSRATTIRSCYALRCGNRHPGGGLAAWNMNGWGDLIEGCLVEASGAGAEIGGTGVTIRRSSFNDSPIKIGSAVHGCSDVFITNCVLDRSQIECGSGVGKLSDIRILQNVLTDSPICWLGAMDSNKVTAPGLPFSDQRSVVACNTITGLIGQYPQALRLTNWSTELKMPPLLFCSNWIDVPDQSAIVIQGMDVGDIDIERNYFRNPKVGIYHPSLPSGTKTPDWSSKIQWKQNVYGGKETPWWQVETAVVWLTN